jgi:hypothetical protein
MDVHEWDEPLFPVPPKYQPPKRERVWPEWRHYKGSRISCNDCVRDIANGNAQFLVPGVVCPDRREGPTVHCGSTRSTAGQQRQGRTTPMTGRGGGLSCFLPPRPLVTPKLERKP